MSNRTVPITQLPNAIRVEEAVESACSSDLQFVVEQLLRGVSVLVECDKEMTQMFYLCVRNMLRRIKEAPKCILIDGRPRPDDPPQSTVSRMVSQLTEAVRGSTEKTIFVIPHLDVMTTTNSGLTAEAKEVIPLLYENHEISLLGFRDPSFEVPKVIRSVFGAHREIVGIPREALPKLITQREARTIHGSHLDPYGLYKYASGFNPVRARKVFSDLLRFREQGPDSDNSKAIFQEIRKHTASDGVELPNVSLDKDIGGYDDVKRRMREEVIDLIVSKDSASSVEKISEIESLLPRGVIFYGPPGTGKTFFAKAMATALNASVIVVSGPEMKSKWVGESEENIRRIFRQARQSAPSVIIFDEIDSFASQRGTHIGSGAEHSMVNQLLTEMDGFRKNEMVFVVATTNFLESLDGALMRPGRFEFMIEIPAPSETDREAIIQIYNKQFGLNMGSDMVSLLVKKTSGMADHVKGLPYAGDHIKAACRALKRIRLRNGETKPITSEDIDYALLRKETRQVVLTPHEEKVVAVHESGHALVAMMLPELPSPEKITIKPDAEMMSLGYVGLKADRHPYAVTEAGLRGRIAMLLGGTLAEKLLLGQRSIGAAQDLMQAAAIARDMVESLAMGQSSLFVRRSLQGSDPRLRELAPSQDSAQRIVEEEQARVEGLLQNNKERLHALVELLLEKKTIEASALDSVMKQQDHTES